MTDKPEIHYCDDYEAITGKERDGSMPGADPVISEVETKVVEPPKKGAAASKAETA